MLVFHKTDRAISILTDGFPENISIRFSNNPLDIESQIVGDMIAFFDIPEAIFQEYEQLEAHSCSERVAIIPSTLINQYRPARILTLKSAKTLDKILKKEY